MKKQAYFLLCALGLLWTLNACNTKNDEAAPDMATPEALSLQNNEGEDAVQDAIDAADDAFDGDDNGIRGGRSEETEGCARITVNDNARTVLVDFGNGCTRGNRTRKGKITINYRGVRNMLAERTILLDAYNNGMYTISGSLTVSNHNLSNGVLSYTVTGTDLVITRPNGKTFRISSLQRNVQYSLGTRLLDPEDDEARITGTTTGTAENGAAFTSTITSPIVMKGSCIRANTFYPVSGTYEIKSGNLTILANWGNGECDKKITITVGNTTIERTMP